MYLAPATKLLTNVRVIGIRYDTTYNTAYVGKHCAEVSIASVCS